MDSGPADSVLAAWTPTPGDLQWHSETDFLQWAWLRVALLLPEQRLHDVVSEKHVVSTPGADIKGTILYTKSHKYRM